MAKREWPLRFTCAHPDCRETTMFRYDTRRDLEASYELRHYGGNRWKCLRHSNPDRVLSSGNPETRAEIVIEQKEYGKYFGSSGFVSGPGFLVYAEDFPVGTKLIVTARIELPEEAQC